MVDLLIIGAGPGGYELAILAAKHNLDVVLVEKEMIGGTCLNSGCIPTKAYYGDAKAIHEIKKFPEITSSIAFDMLKAKERKDKLISELKGGIEFLLKKTNVKVINGIARITANNEVTINDNEVVHAKNIVIATGSTPKKINIPGVNNKNVLNSKEILDITEVPKKLVIIGGGVIGVEMASIFNSFGSDVTIIEIAPTILPTFDKEIVRRFQAYLKSSGIKLLLKTGVSEIKEKTLTYNIDSVLYEMEYDKLLLAIGRKANTEDIWSEKLDIKTTPAGIIVDDNFQTNIPGIYAIGDVNGQIQLAHYATYSGYHVLNNILGDINKTNFALIPACVFSFPELASIGLTEEECVTSGIEYKVLKGLYRANGKANAILSTDGFVKLIIQNDKIIGAHIIGADANILIHELVILMNANISVADAKNYIHAHPTLSEIIATLFRE